MSLTIFWIGVFLAWAGVAYVAYLHLKTRKVTKHNTHRIGKLEISVEELWSIIHNKHKDGGN